MGLDMDQHYEKIYKYCYFRLHNRDLAEDITQETFLRFFTSDTTVIRDKHCSTYIPLQEISVLMNTAALKRRNYPKNYHLMMKMIW